MSTETVENPTENGILSTKTDLQSIEVVTMPTKIKVPNNI